MIVKISFVDYPILKGLKDPFLNHEASIYLKQIKLHFKPEASLNIYYFILTNAILKNTKWSSYKKS